MDERIGSPSIDLISQGTRGGTWLTNRVLQFGRKPSRRSRAQQHPSTAMPCDDTLHRCRNAAIDRATHAATKRRAAHRRRRGGSAINRGSVEAGK
ncbi:hypothetical protein RPC_3640 [Rhodopseudomonas palustris BisB18]|uniref:Uncharacterized protein n=1 Tax=Rhodopseudomonas palustris (strain BisB18) TaxID=316056 RepID=Q210L1_RHOPB